MLQLCRSRLGFLRILRNLVVLGEKMGCNMLVMMLPRFVLHVKPKTLVTWGLLLGIFAAVSQQPPTTHGFPATGDDGVMETLDIVAENPDKFKVVVQAAGSNVTLLADQDREGNWNIGTILVLIDNMTACATFSISGGHLATVDYTMSFYSTVKVDQVRELAKDA